MEEIQGRIREMMESTHTNYNIIAFGGRKESGKTELANICTKYGYERISFAKPLKLLICKLLKLDSIEALNGLKNKEIGHIFDEDDYKLLSNETGIGINQCKELTSKLNEASTGRDYLQIIGTDLIRKCYPNWHVNRTMELIKENKKYVFDDVRFPNELNALKNINAECWFVIRPKVDNISHHISEEAVDMTMFDGNVIVNDGPLQKITIRWDIYMNTHVEVWGFRQNILDNTPHSWNDANIDDYEKYFLYPRLDELYDVKESVDVLMKTHCVIPTQDNNAFAVCYNNIVCYVDKDPFRVEFMKKYYNR